MRAAVWPATTALMYRQRGGDGIQTPDCAGRTKRSYGLRELLREMSLKHVKRAIRTPGRLLGRIGRRGDGIQALDCAGRSLNQGAGVDRVVAVVPERIADRVRHDDRGGEMDNGVDSMCGD